jgi:large subunit ribosomal protein L13
MRLICNRIRRFRSYAPRNRSVSMKTYIAKPETVQSGWYVVDASGKVLGRLASEIARRLRGKHKPEFTPHVDTGDYIVVVNADKLRVTGRKADNKIYYRHSTYPGGIYAESFAKLHARQPERVLRLAVKGMLPKGPLGYAMLKKMKVYTGASHPHTAQQPKQLEV